MKMDKIKIDKMNKRGITTIMEQFIIFALGIVIFVMITYSFQQIGENIEQRNNVLDVSQATVFLATNVVEVWEIANTGENAEVERTLSIPLQGSAEFRTREVCLITENSEECSPIPLDVELKGKAYTLEKFTLISTKEGVELKNAR